MGSRLSLLIWPDYIDPATLAAFERETGISIDLEVVPSAVDILERMRSGVRPPDVLTPPSYLVTQLRALGRLATLDHSRLPNLRHLEARFQRGRAHDPDSRFSVIKDWGTTGFMYRIDKVHELPASWADFWRLAAKYSGHVTVLDSPGEVIGAALKMRGHSYNACDPQALAGARLDLFELKRHLLCFDTNYRPRLGSGDAWLSLGWNGDAAALRAAGVPIWYVIPSEGTQIWEDDWAIAADAPNLSAAHTFLDFVLRPEIAAQEAIYTRYATGNSAAQSLLDEAVRNDRSTYPPRELTDKLEAGLPLDPECERRRKALWQDVRT